MSAPQTNIEKQKRRHRGPLIGMAVVVTAVLGMFLWWLFDEAYKARDPDIDPGLPAAQSDASSPGGQATASP